MEKLSVGICGWGNVATGLFNALNDNAQQIRNTSGLDISIGVIGARRDNPKCDPGKISIERNIFNVKNHKIDVLVELIGGVETARELILDALNSKIHVVTANKAVLFHHGDEIFDCANKNNVKILFESAVCAGTPIIKILNEELAANKITKIAGMLNGTSNFILSNMEDGKEFQATLELAQEEGYAEPDPSFDIEGMDAAHKIGILSSMAYGTNLPPENFHIAGITKIDKVDFKYALDMGYTIKHLAVAKINGDQIELRAHPVLIESDSYLANLRGVRNGIEIETDLVGTIHIAGSGAGQESTASGIISDLVNIANSKNNLIKTGNNKLKLKNFLDLQFQYYFYIEAEDTPGVMASITSVFGQKDVGIETIVQKESLADNHVPIVIITDPYYEKDNKHLTESISKLNSVKIIRSIRIENK